MHRLPPEFIAELRKIVGGANLKEAEATSTLDYGVAPENLGAGVVVLPATTEEVAAVVKSCRANAIPLVTHGGRTGLVGGAISRQGELVLSTARLNRIQSISPIENVAVVEAGVTLQALQTAAAEHRLEAGIDIPSRGSATVGGMAATNAGGIAAFRYGVMRHRILGLEAVLADGSIYCDLTRVIKNAAGYDLKHLFVGSEGTLGVITRLAIRLEPQPSAAATMLLGLPSVDAALATVRRGLYAQYGQLRAAEAIWKTYFGLTSGHHRWSATDYRSDHPVNLLISLGGGEEAALQTELENIYGDVIADHPDTSAVVASSGAQEAEIWRLREDTDLIYRRYPGAPSYDVSVPLSEVKPYLDRTLTALKELDAALDPYVFGHLADGNLHIVLNAAGGQVPAEKAGAIEAILYRDLGAIGGSFSAEHGIGTKRAGSLRATASPAKLALMHRVKEALDPGAILNRDKVLEGRCCSDSGLGPIIVSETTHG
ncbi:FAD-binding oxidoreductase [Rhizobium esperanzae]|uniref:FAD/FMN-containing dehydrogenase n=1 Tax=Rhizobium esperanzae TaxID=1967781 RepID=A0A7W6R164_9HYPH|nr:FAD-binding oxidoreductase [Rhizobium esperanzae]MBB4234949.1 FAD/FMN-containing dehydrogenase [Rhizobium esperanzae]